MDFEQPLQTNSNRIFRRTRYGTDRFVLLGSTKMHYIEAGQGPPVIFVPGSAANTRLWRRIMPSLETAHRLIALDFQPFESGRQPEKEVEAAAERIAAMIKLLDLGKVSLVGGNLGGAIIFNLAARYPELAERVASFSGYIGLKKKNTRVGPFHQHHTGSDEPDRLEVTARKIECPILYLYGSKTNTGELPLARNLEYLQKYHPQAWVVSLGRGVFEVALTNPQEIIGLLQDFLKFRPGLRIG